MQLHHLSLAFMPALPVSFQQPPRLLGPRRRPRRGDAALPSRHPLPFCCALDPHPHANRSPPSLSNDLVSFASWCNHNDIVLNSIEVLAKSPSHRGLFATAPIAPGTPVLIIPRRSALIADMSTTDPPHFEHLPVSSAFWKSCSWPIRLALHLLNELLTPSTAFNEYLSVMPSDPASALWAYESLGRTALSAQLARYRFSDALDTHRKLVKHAFVALHNDLPVSLRDQVSLRTFSWAVSIAQSRAFGIPPPRNNESAHDPTKHKIVTEPTQYALFPALDMANHSVHCPTSLLYDDVQDAYIVSTAAAFKPGDEVFFSYGPKSNDELMFFYGFVEGNNPANSVTITDFREWVLGLAHSYGIEADWDRKLAIFVEQGLTDPHRLFHLRLDKVPDDLMLVVRLAVASSAEVDDFLQNLAEDTATLSKPICLENELTAWAAIAAKCQELLHDLGDFTPEEQLKLTEMFARHPCSAAWQWGEQGSPGELLYRYERQEVLSATSERVLHFAHVSSAVGRICTVLVPPSQSLLKTDLFSGMGENETAGVHRFSISPED